MTDGRRRFRRTALWSAFLAVLLPLMAAERRPALTDDDTGRLLLLKTGGATGERFLIFREQADSGKYLCASMTGAGAVTVDADAVFALPFHENITPALLSEYVLMYCFSGQDYQTCMALSKLLGPTPRLEYFEKFEQSLAVLKQSRQRKMQRYNELLRELNAEVRGRSRDDITLDLEANADELQLLLEDSEAFRIIQQTATGGDLLLATVLFERFKRFAEQEFAPRQNNGVPGAEMAKLFDETLRGLLAECRNRRNSGGGRNVREEEFRKLFPTARGLWSEAPPADLTQLRENIRRSFMSFLALEEFSEVAEFETWGSRMLDVLLFSQGTPEAKELEENFDSALQNYRKRFNK